MEIIGLYLIKPFYHLCKCAFRRIGESVFRRFPAVKVPDRATVG